MGYNADNPDAPGVPMGGSASSPSSAPPPKASADAAVGGSSSASSGDFWDDFMNDTLTGGGTSHRTNWMMIQKCVSKTK